MSRYLPLRPGPMVGGSLCCAECGRWFFGRATRHCRRCVEKLAPEVVDAIEKAPKEPQPEQMEIPW